MPWALAGLLLLLPAVSRPAQPTPADEAWLVIQQEGQVIGQAREQLWLVAGGAGVRVERRARAGPVHEQLLAAMDATGRYTAHYRRSGGGDPVEVELTGDRLRWRFGPFQEEVVLPGPPPIPSALLRTGRWSGPQRILLEEYGLLCTTEVVVFSDPARGRRVRYTIRAPVSGATEAGIQPVSALSGLTEEVRVDQAGRLLELTAHPMAIRVLRGLPPEPEARTELLRPWSHWPPGQPGHWEAPTPELEALAQRSGDAAAILRWVASAIRPVADDRYRTAAEVLTRGAADCTGRATLAATLLRRLGWTVQHVVGDRRAGSGSPWIGHQWLLLGQGRAAVELDPDGTAVSPATHRALLRFGQASPRTLLEAELWLQWNR